MSRDDQRIRDLVNRLVAMAPEPPPFPEEEVTLTTRTTPTRPRPALAFAGAALLVLLGAAIPLLLLNTNGGPPAGTTTPPVTEPPPVETTAEPDTTVPASVTTEPTQTTTTVAMALHNTGVYLVQTPENTRSGNPALINFWTEAVGPEGAPVELLGLRLLTDERLDLPAPGFFNAIPPDVEFLGLTREGNAIVLEVNEAFRAGAGGLLADMTMLNQIVYTATYMNDAESVRFLIDGREVTDFGTDGLDLSGGVDRETFRDSLNMVLVTEPLVYGGDDLPMVAGIANVFEATVSLEILDSAGEVVYEDFTTASCGTGCWGEFSFSLDTPAITADSLVRVFWSSPEDGSPMDVVYVPVDGDGVWELAPRG